VGVRILLLVATLLAAGAVGGGCGGAENDYSDEAVSEFMTRCSATLGSESCNCVLDNFKKSLTPEEFELILSNLRPGSGQELSDDLGNKVTEASKPCMNEPSAETETGME
jgi:hypothetical protein